MCQTMSFCFHFVCTTVRFSKVGQTTSTFARSGEDVRAKRKAGVNRPSVSPTMSLPSNHAKGADAQFGNARALAVKEQAGHQAVAQEPRLNREQDLCTHTGNAFEALAGKAEQSADSQKLLL